MKTLLRYAGIVFTAFVLAVGLGMGTDSPYGSVAEAQLGTTWDISVTDTAMTSSGPGGTTQNSSTDSHRTSSDGETEDDHQSSQRNEDGSGSEQENFTHDDDKCRKAGGFSRHTTIDKNGNRTVQTQTVWYENGKCEIVITKAKFDKNNKPIGTPEVKPYPCAEYKLEMKLDGSISAAGGEVTWGPNRAVIPLTQEDRTYKGSYDGQFTATVIGECNGCAIYPMSLQVTAVEDEFEDLEFTLKGTMGYQVSMCCEGGCGSNSMPNMPANLNFTLPAQDGASKVYAMASGGVRYTFTLRKQCGGK